MRQSRQSGSSSHSSSSGGSSTDEKPKGASSTAHPIGVLSGTLSEFSYPVDLDAQRRGVLDYESFIEGIRISATNLLSLLEKTPYRKALKIKPDFSGVYAISDPSGRVQYIGKAKKVIQRLKQHLSYGIVEKILQERGIPERLPGKHVCECSRSIECHSVTGPIHPMKKVVSNEILKSWFVSIILCQWKVIEKANPDFETFMQIALRVKYGVNWRA
jgi:hypothetical protein